MQKNERLDMTKNKKTVQFFYSKLLSEEVRKKSEGIIISVAIISFILHLLLVVLVNLNLLHVNEYSTLFTNPIAAIYTPFSFILIYEVYLLVFYLPKSTTIYIGKQYEIITLILIRGIFKDLANLEFTREWFRVNSDLKFTYDLIATLVLFFLIFIFYRLNDRKDEEQHNTSPLSDEILKFIRMKNIIAMCLIPIFLILAVFGLGRWIHQSFISITRMVDSFKDINTIFFNDFFTILILTDVLLLLLSFSHTDKFNKVIRNSGFIISTILIKLSFGSEGLLNTILIVTAVLFGVMILLIHNQYKKITLPENH
ncbi:MAG: hypothetical protein NTX43_04060 [Bacteroidetes bacterium]|nr:hypothetical protein [Bacteroidota bacterium]